MDMSESVDDRIANIVNLHVRILKFLSITDEALQHISFVEFIGCTLNLCLLGYYILMEWNSHDIAVTVTYALILISFGFNIFIFCYIGELVAEQCNRVGEVAYMIDWYRLQGKKRQCIILIMAMSNSSSKLTAGSMVELSLSTFGDVLKTAMAYMNMLLAFGPKTMSKLKTISAISLAKENEHTADVNLSIQWNRWILRAMGIWPSSRELSGLEKCSNWLINVVCYTLISFLFLPCWLFMMLEVDDLYNKLKLFGPLSFCVMAYMKYYSLMVHANDIRNCIERIEWDWKTMQYLKDREIMVANAKFGQRLVKICMFFMYSGFVFYYIALPISIGRVTVEGQNLTFIPMVFPMTKLMPDTQYSPVNEIFFSIQFLGGIVIHGVSAATCSLVAALAVHACGQVKILAGWLEHLIEGRSDMSESVDKRIARLVSQHVRILKFLSTTETAMRQISFVEFIGCTLNLCLLGYYVIMEWDPEDIIASVTFITILVSLGFNIFIFCYIGDLVAEHCSKVGEVAYMIDWYQLWGNRKRCLVLIIAMSNSSTKLTAGKMVELSLSTFGDVVKTAVGFLNMLLALTN
ncbi:odorant receptor 4-like [Megalopta genalis]|uniref:odorant receptor 4-like n=1 Tax=Megalopta genalis TaxID=115081 RepID=UPI003FD0EB7B